MSQALTDTEIERLSARLLANQNPGALSLEGVDGLFCALIASPSLIAPSVYLPVILGGDPGESRVFSDKEDATEMLSLLVRYWNAISEDFRSEEPIHLAYIEEPGTDNIVGRDWARGFLRGTRLAPEGWSRLFQDEKEGLAITIPLVAGEIDPQWPKEPLSSEKSDELLQWMFAGAARAFQYFESDRRAFAERKQLESVQEPPEEPYVRPEPKIGRNEPCPCGSGKKFKHCCGAPPTGSIH
jgi:uncharacterized protein